MGDGIVGSIISLLVIYGFLTESDFYRYQTVEKGSRVALMGLSNFFGLAGQVKELLKEKAGIEATVINPRMYSALDREMLESLKTDHRVVITLEDGSVSGALVRRSPVSM